jgi:predicted transposase/invertase (TIGR01784 family)
MRENILSVTDDLIFKLVFGDERSKNILMHFLNTIIKDKITSLEIRKTELTPEFFEGKEVRLDIVATADDSKIINIEMQKCNEGNMRERSLFYWSELYFQQLHMGECYGELKRTICINILEYRLFKDNVSWHTYHMREDNTHEMLSDKEEIHFIEIPKMKGYERDKPVTLWIEFLKDPESDIIKREGEREPGIKEAVNMFGRVMADPETQERLRMIDKGKRDFGHAISCAGQRGMEKGERKKARETAMKMLNRGMSVLDIVDITGLTVKDIKKLRQRIIS